MWRIWAAALFWGLNWPAIKILLTGASPWTLRAAGLSAGTLLLAGATLAMGQSLRVDRRYWASLVVAGLLNVAAFNVLAVFAQMTMTASRAAILTYTMPLWSVLFGSLVLGERIDIVRGFVLALGAAGIALLAAPFWPSIVSGRIPPGLAFVLASAITWAAGTVYLKWATPQGDPLALTTWQFVIGAAAATLGMLAFESPRLELGRPDLLAVFIYHVVFPQAAAYALWFDLMARIEASKAALGTLLVPIVAVVSSSLWLGEKLSLLDFSGFAAILGAILIDQGFRAWIGPPRRPSTR